MSGDKLTADGKRRLQTMVETNDGFQISEVDMELRGPGDMQGTQQSGMLQMRIANLAKDQQILQNARNAAADLLQNDPNLQQPEHTALLRYLQTADRQQGQSEWSRIS